MKYFLVLFLLTGCGISPIQDDLPKLTGAILISEGSAGALIAPVSGNVDYCKITQWGVVDIQVTYKGDKCDFINKKGNSE